MNILYPNSTPADGATLLVSNRTGNLLSSIMSGPDGRTPRQEITEYIRTWNGTTYFTPLSLNATKDGLARNLSVNLNQNMDLSLTLADVTAPSLYFTSPANNTLLNRTTCVLSGAASDDQGVASVRLRAGTGDWLEADGTDSWTATLELAEGDNLIVAEALDAEGNAGRAYLRVKVDSLPPIVNITYPPDGTLVNATFIELTGSTEPGCTVLIDGETAPFYLGQFSAEVPLQEGPNTITVTARDAAGNVGMATVAVTRDTIPPALALTSPRDGEVSGRAVLTVSGTAEIGAAVLVNGAAASRSGAFFSADVMLAEGANNITVSAVDAAGNRASATVRVSLDTTAPMILADLANGTIVHEATLRLTGRTEPGVSLAVNGVPVAVGPGGNFSTNLPLIPGPNTIRLEAKDPAGNAAWLERTVTYEEPAKPPAPAAPKPSPGIDVVYVAASAVVFLILIAVMYLLTQRLVPPPRAGKDGKDESLPEGRGP